MIRVNDDYIIEVDSLNYTVKRDAHKTRVTVDKDTGEETENNVFVTVGYYKNFASAIESVIGDMNRRQLSEGVHSLKESLNIILENNKRFSELLEKALEV